MLHLLQKLSREQVAWSIAVIIYIAVLFWFLHRKGKKPGKVARKGKVIVLDECEERFYSDYEKENWN